MIELERPYPHERCSACHTDAGVKRIVIRPVAHSSQSFALCTDCRAEMRELLAQ